MRAVVIAAAMIGSCGATLSSPALAQAAAGGGRYLEDGVSPFGPVEPVSADGVVMPQLAFAETTETKQNYDKYYVFHRDDTSFPVAYADLVECDGYARGLQDGMRIADVPYPYAGTLAGGLGGALGNAMAQAIFGSGEKRRLRRVNMRTCMHFKGYQRFGLSKDAWQTFNFEEGLSSVDDAKRAGYLKRQALVASHGTPQGSALGL